MRARQRLSSGDLLLLELVFAIIFFSLSIAATMSVFGKAYELSSGAAGRNMAVTESNAAAEIIRASSDEAEADELLKKGGFTFSQGRYFKDYGDGKYCMTVDTAKEGRLFRADISCYKVTDADAPASDPVYSLTIEHAMKGDATDGR